MALQAAQTVVTTGITPAALTPSASETIAASDIVPGGGCIIRVITTGTATNVSVQDPNLTAQGNAGTVVPVACPATGVREILIPVSAVNNSTGVATILFSGALTGVTYEIKKF
jgi:hypothetical protein